MKKIKSKLQNKRNFHFLPESKHVSQFNPVLLCYGFESSGNTPLFTAVILLTLHSRLRTLWLFRQRAHLDLPDITMFFQDQLDNSEKYRQIFIFFHEK